nr:PBSX family phage terminase large subunit [Clostridium niameyense]
MFKKDYIPQKYNVIYGGTGSSKSFSLIEMLVEKCILHSTFDILVVRKYATTLKDTVEMPWLDMITKRYINVLSNSGLKEGRDFTYNRTLKHIKFASGSIVRFKGYDNPEKLKGIDNVNVLWLEECTDFTQSDLEDIQDRLRATPPPNHIWGRELKIFCTFNPIFKSHWIRTYFFKDEIDMSEEIHKDTVIDSATTFSLKTTWRDNKFYNGQYQDEKLRNKMKIKNPRKYGVQCNGNWGVLGELIYEHYKVDILEKDHSYYEDISYGLDFGFDHSTAFHELGKKDGDIYVLRELYKPKLTVTDIMKELKRMYPNTYNSIRIYADNARPEAIEEMRRAGFSGIRACTKGANSVLEGIEWLQDRTIYIDESCTGAKNEIESYQWQKDKRTGERIPKPIKVNDDAMDSIRYGTEKFKKDKKLRVAWC